MAENGRWRIWIDTGGTFTDAVALDPAGRPHMLKILSSAVHRSRVERVEGEELLHLDSTIPDGLFDGAELESARGERWPILQQRGSRLKLGRGTPLPAVGEPVSLRSPLDAPLLAAHWLSATPAGAKLPTMDLRVATTRGTNALLQRRGARCALLLTEGLEDILEIRTQQRPELFARVVRKAVPFASRRAGIGGRLDARGRALEELDEESTRELLRQLADDGFESVGIALLHSYLNPSSEERVEAWAREAGFRRISLSSRLAAVQGYLERATSCELNAYLQPLMDDYLDSLRGSLMPGSTLSVMRSSGTLLPATRFQPVDGLLSGPAGGALGARLVAEQLGLERALCFDMGGTSTDVARVEGDLQISYSHRVGEALLPAEAVDLETVAAGGGSICHVEHGLPKVGPQSAGAQPGPACYGNGGPLAITDANVLLGRIRPERFPFALDLEAARDRLRECREPLGDAAPAEEELLAGYLQLANERMAAAIRRMSVRRGHDPTDHSLIAFGGAGGQHACAIAELLDIDAVVFPAHASLLSALGVGHARHSHTAQRQILCPLSRCGDLDARLRELEAEALAELRADGVEKARVERRVAELRFEGQESCLSVAFEEPAELEAGFCAEYESIYEHRPVGREIELVSLRVHALGEERWATRVVEPSGTPTAETTTRLHDGVRWVEARVCERSSLEAGAGPLLIEEAHSVVYLPAGWRVEAHASGALLARREKASAKATARYHRALSVELFQHRFEAIARNMGERLRRTAVSTNVKEREDFSCALLDPEGSLVVNAPHIPVHLGALGSCLRRVRAEFDLAPGDMILTNHPAYGGSHLPDLTLLAAVYDDGGELLGHVACRAHHAEIGGITPGSMPARATRLSQEAVVLPPLYVARGGVTDLSEFETLLSKAKYPSRAPVDNVADTGAMVAACRAGMEELRSLALKHGRDVIVDHMRALREQAARQMRETLRSLPGGIHSAEEILDDGSVLAVSIQIDAEAGSARFDFDGSSAVHPGNLNATEAVVRSCVLYVLRLLVREDLPFNEGLFEPVELHIPRGILSPDFVEDPDACPAVVGGNVETSQRLVDCMLRALGLSAASQGSMNNLSFGNERFGYYETLGGGCGAQPEHDGESAVHSHMTNTRITDVEILEYRFPVRVEEFSVRRGSGGAGRWRGGDGLRRRLLFLEDMSLSVLTQRREAGAPGAHGGAEGQPGCQRVLRADGRVETLRAQDECRLEAGDRLEMETPGGGGWGSP